MISRMCEVIAMGQLTLTDMYGMRLVFVANGVLFVTVSRIDFPPSSILHRKMSHLPSLLLLVITEHFLGE